MEYYKEPSKQIPVINNVDVVVAGGGTGGVFAALAAARQGAKTVLLESKGYTGGTAVEGGTALHSFYNLWKAFPGVKKKQLVRGIPEAFIQKLYSAGGTAGHCEMVRGYDYDSVCTAIDTEIYKSVSLTMLKEAGVVLYLNTLLTDAVTKGGRISGVIIESRSGREMIKAKAFVDATGYGDLSHRAGASYTEPNDYPVVNSMSLGGVNIEKFKDFLQEREALGQLAYGRRSGKEKQIIRLGGSGEKFPAGFHEAAREIGMSNITTSVWDDYFMFIKLNYKMPVSPTNRDEATEAELELRSRMNKGVELFRKYIPGCKKAFIARTSPQLTIRRARCIKCDYDISREDVLEARHFEDDVFTYGFMDYAPRLQIKNGGSYGTPYRALCVKGIENLYATGMMITSNKEAHMSTRNTVSCMGHGQAAGTAAALIAKAAISSRELRYDLLRKTLLKDDVVLEN